MLKNTLHLCVSAIVVPMNKRMQKLTKTEEEIMQLIWDAERATVSDLLQQMQEPKPPHSTVSSVVRILERKGYVGHKAYGKNL